MPVVRPRLFLSSTSHDLRPFREAVVHVGQRLGFEVVAMEEFGPDPRRAAALCREKVDTAAVARRPPPPVLAFLVDEELAWPPRWVEHGPGWDRLQEFKARLRSDHVVAQLTTPEQLRDDLFVHLPKFLERVEPTPAPAAPALPQPPEPYVVHQYTLLQTAQVPGPDGIGGPCRPVLVEPLRDRRDVRPVCDDCIGLLHGTVGRRRRGAAVARS